MLTCRRHDLIPADLWRWTRSHEQLRDREIADALTITEGTVKNYVSSILAKMGVRDRTRAVLKALDSGIL
jgi:DNA-binding CsgD family transcriptional regulator